MKDNDKVIHFHIGMGKAASTFLQYQFFPYLKNIKYLQRGKYHNYKFYIDNCKSNNILISREMDNQLIDEVSRFLKIYPKTKIIVVFRKQEEWILSQYKRQVKNGFPGSLKDFVDVENNAGKWKTNQAEFTKIIDFLDKKTIHKPLIINYKDLKINTKPFFDKIVNYCDANYNFGSLNLTAKHKSYSTKQLIFKRKLNRYFFKNDWENSNYKLINWLKRRFEMLLTYFIFLIAFLIPKTMLKKEKLYDSKYLEKIKTFYKADWENVLKHC